MKKKLLLIIPPQKGLLKGFATGVVSLAEYLYLHGKVLNVQVEIVDYSLFSLEEVEISSSEYARDLNLIVGVTTTTASYQSALRVAKCFKEINPKCKVLFGGHHSTADPETILIHHKDIVDHIILGEGEIALYEYVKHFPKMSNVSNLVYWDSDRIIKNRPAPLLTEKKLDEISLTYKKTSLYGQAGKFDTITYVSARGCPLRCFFCAVANQQMRAKSPLQVKSDIMKLLKLGFNTIAIEDNFFAHSPKRTFEISDVLKSIRKKSPDFKWDCQTRVESLKNTDVIKAMEDAGCYAAYIGVEAVNHEHLMYLGKTKNPERYLELLSDTVIPNMLESKIDCYLNLQLGIPNSNFGHHKQTIDFLQFIGKKAIEKKKVITIFPQLHVVYPGTKHFYDGVVEKRFKADVFESFTKWEIEQNNLYGWMGENFAHGTGGIPEGIVNNEELTASIFTVNSEKILRIQRELADIKSIEGIQIFEYKKYLV